jgi:hypothetical protein
MAELTRDDVEDVRDALDKVLDTKKIRHATARNVWGTLTGALKAAYAARDRSLRVHKAPLHFGFATVTPRGQRSQGVGERVLQRRMGHASGATTDR